MSQYTIYTPTNDKAVVDAERFGCFKLHLEPLTAAPTDIENGDMWYLDASTDHIQARIGGSTVNVA